jgi:hypothetical protein
MAPNLTKITLLTYKLLIFSLHLLIISKFKYCYKKYQILAQGKYLPNIDYLGHGYNIIKGNPHTHSIDPGYQTAVVELTYKEVIISKKYESKKA